MIYNYYSLIGDLKNFPDLNLFTLGKSLRKRELFCIKCGNGSKKLLISAAFHGTEWITSMVLMHFIKELYIGSPYISLDDVCLYLVPMVNPDGIEIHKGSEAPMIDFPTYKYNKENYWQANARGVDINHNFDADWERSKASEKENGIFSPGPTRFSGTHPESEPESRALADLVRHTEPNAVMALHSQGEVIYYDFDGFIPEESFDIVQRMCAVSGYSPELPEGMASCGGFKDWFIDKFKRPGFTVEVGLGQNPLPINDLEGICEKIMPLLREFCTSY